MNKRLNVGIAGLYFSNFEAVKHDIYPSSIRGMEKLAENLGFNLIAYPELVGDETEAVKANLFFKEKGVDFLILQASSLIMGDVIPPLADNSFRLGFWMVPETDDGSEIQLNSMTGYNLGVSIIRKSNPERKIKWYYGTASDADFINRFTISVKALTALKRLDGSCIAVADEAVPGFINLTYDPVLLKSNLGLNVEKLPLDKLFSEMKNVSSDDAAKAAEIKAEIIADSTEVDVPEAEIDDSAKTAEALMRLGGSMKFQAAALKCWPEFQSEFHMAPCTAIAYLNDNGLPTSCEGDVPGAVSMLAAYYINEDAPTMNDPVAINPELNLVQMWHCGPGPASWADENGRKIDWHHTLNRRVGEEQRKFGLSSDLAFKKGAVTMLRISGDGNEIFILEGDVVDGPSKPYCGSGGWIGNLKSGGRSCCTSQLLQAVADYGLDHHYPIMHGHWEKVLREMASWTGMKVLEMPESRDYLV